MGIVAKIIVTLLVVSPFEVPVPNTSPEPLFVALKKIAWDLEISGPSCPWTLDFRSEVRWVKNRVRESKDFPHLSDVALLPPYQFCQTRLTIFTEDLRWLKSARSERLHWQDRLQEPISETEHSICVWVTLCQCHDSSNSWICQRQRLKDFKELVGSEQYDELKLLGYLRFLTVL